MKRNITFCIPCAIVLFSVLVNGRTINLFDIIGSILLTIIYCLFLLYTLIITNQNSNGRLAKYMWFFLTAFSFAVLNVSLLRPVVGWDSWQVYDMSKYVFSDFGYMDQIRQHIANTHYEMAFPPIFPYFMAIVNCIYGMGVYAAVYLNAIFVLLCFVELSRIFKIENIEMIGGISTVIVFCGTLFVYVYIQGLTQPLGYYLLILLSRLILGEKKYNSLFALKCGICCGLLLMNRFDALAIVAVMFLTIPFLMYKQYGIKDIVKNVFIYSIVVILICSPWIVYSLSHFDSIFITDNGRRLFNIPDTRPSSFFPENNPALTIWDSFPLWVTAFSSRALQALRSLGVGLLKYSLFFEILVGYCLLFRKKALQTLNIRLDHKVIAIIVIILGQEALFIFTGYDDIRYHLPIIFIL